MFYRVIYTCLALLICFVIHPKNIQGESGYLSSEKRTSSKNKHVGIIVSLKGKALITRSGGTRILAKLKTPIYIGDRLDTGVGAQVQIDFIDHSKISLMGSSDFTVEAYKFDKNGNSQFETKVENGLIRFMSGKIGKLSPQNYKIKTAFATIGIRGTSGEANIANGKIPGRPMNLEVMKKGGVGLTLAPIPFISGAPPPPEQLITHSGQGFVMSEPGRFETKFFARSPSKKYEVEEKRRIQEAKRQDKKEAKESDRPFDDDDGDGQLADEDDNGNGNDQLADDADDGDDQLADKEEKKQESSLAAASQEEDPQEKSPIELSQEESPIELSQEESLTKPNQEKPLVDTNLKTFNFDDSYALAETIEAQQKTFVEAIPVEKTVSGVLTVLTEASGSTADIVENNTNITVSEDLTETLTGFEFQGHNVGSTFTSSTSTNSFSDSIFGSVSDDLSTLTIGFTNSDYELNIDYPASSGTSYSSISSLHVPIDPSDPTSTVQYRRITDNLSEFFVVEVDDQFSSASESNTSRIMYLGKATESTALPSSGIKYYSSMFNELIESSGVTFESSDQMDIEGGILAKDNAILSPTHETMAFVDYNHHILAGALAGGFEFPVFGDDLFLYKNSAFLPNSTHTENFTNTNTVVENVLLNGTVPIILFRGNLEDDGTFSNVQLYNNIGFMPEEIVSETSSDPFATTSSTLSSTDKAAYTFNSTNLNAFSGSGQIYGSEVQGIGVNATDNASGLFISGGFLEVNENQSFTNTSTTYTGGARGLKINPTNFFATMQSSSDFSITPDFTNNTLSGTASVGADTIVIGGTGQSFAVTRNIAFGEITSTDLSAVSNSSFIMTQDLPQAFPQGTSQSNNPADIMWGTWNIVTNAGNNYIYPGLHNYWVTGIVDAIPTPSASDDFLIYEGGSLGSFVDMNTVSATTGIPNILSYMSSTKFVVEVDSSSGNILEMSGIAFSPSGNLILMKKNAGKNPVFSGWTSMFSIHGGNISGSPGFFYTNSTPDALGNFSGSFTSDGDGLFFDYARSYHGSALEAAYGVGALIQTSASADIDTGNYSGYTQGVAMSNGNFSQLIDPISDYATVSLAGAASSTSFGGSLTLNTGTSMTLSSVSDNINTFISKDAFLSKLSISTGALDPTGAAAYSGIDSDNSFFIGLSGLESLDHVSWGIWGAQETATTNRAFGYMGFGEDTALTDFSAYATANSSSPVVSYSGRAIGTIFDAINTNGVFHQGTASLSIDFSGGSNSTTGNISIGSLSIDLANITADTINDRFTGNTQLNGNTITGGLSGSVYGSTAADEAVGSFRASDNASTHVIGAFAAGKAGTP